MSSHQVVAGTLTELTDVPCWLSIKMCISIFAILERFDKTWKARVFSDTLLATSMDRHFFPQSWTLGYCSSQTLLCCYHAQSCLFICCPIFYSSILIYQTNMDFMHCALVLFFQVFFVVLNNLFIYRFFLLL